jgi:dTDP-glucose 4,6-dehydratase
VTELCLSKGWKVYGIDSCTYAANLDHLKLFEANKNFKFVKQDISELSYLPDCDYVINIAAESHVGNSIVDSSDFLQTNVVGVKNLLDLIRRKQGNVCRKPIFFHFSTDEVYGDIESGEHFETDHLKPSNPYSASKAAADMLIAAWARTYNIEWIILRPTNNYGLNQYPEKLIPLSVKLLQRGKKIRLHDKGMPIRNWLHASDTATAVTAIIDSGVVNEVFNVSGGFEQENWKTVKSIIEYYHFSTEGDIFKVNWKDYVDLEHVREGQDVRYSLNDDKLRGLGWRPNKVFDREIEKIVEHYIKHFKW